MDDNYFDPESIGKCLCLSCLKSNSWRFYEINSKKWKSLNLARKIYDLAGLHPEKNQRQNIGVCDSRAVKVDTCWQLMQSLKKNIEVVDNMTLPAKRGTSLVDDSDPNDTKRSRTGQSVARKLFNPSNSTSTDYLPPSHTPGKRTPIADVQRTIHPSIEDHNYQKQECLQKKIAKGSSNPSKLPFLGEIGSFDVAYDKLGIINPSEVTMLKTAVESSEVENIINMCMLIPKISTGVKRKLLEEIHNACSGIASLKNPSILRSIDLLTECNLPYSCIEEMNERCQFLLDVFLAAAIPQFERVTERHIGPISLVYAILMHLRNQQLSAYQRVLTLVMTKGSINEHCLMTCNKLALTLSPTSKINLLDECSKQTTSKAVQLFKSCCLCSLVGDNCDIQIKPHVQTSDHRVQDCHYFAILLVFARMSTQIQQMSAIPPVLLSENIDIKHFTICMTERTRLLESYKVMLGLGRMMVRNLPAFKWLDTILPKHILHQFSDTAQKKSTVKPLQMILKNEAKYEDCVSILDESVEIIESVHGAAGFGNEINSVPYYGDQLTRVRLQGAKMLRSLSPTRRARFDAVGPFLCTLWHMKQDFVHKAYKHLWKAGATRDQGTLNFFKTILWLSDVNGNVKANYEAHAHLLLMVGEFYMMEQVITYLNMDGCDSWPSCVPQNIIHLGKSVKVSLANSIILGILEHYKYAELLCDVTGVINDQQAVQADEVMNHASHLCAWAMHLLHMNDMAKEGDIDRAILSCKFNVPYFFTHSKYSKYYVECVDFLLKTQHICSPQMRLHLLDTCFVNSHGGPGNNVEIDLVMEHSIRNKKDVVKTLGANKTESAVKRVTMAADTVATITHKFGNAIGVLKRSGKHSKIIQEVDRVKIRDSLRQLRPFEFCAGRKYRSVSKLPSSPIAQINHEELNVSLRRVITRLCRGQTVHVHEENDLVEQECQPELVQ